DERLAARPAPSPHLRQRCEQMPLSEIVEHGGAVVRLASHHGVADAPRQDQPSASFADAVRSCETDAAPGERREPVAFRIDDVLMVLDAENLAADSDAGFHFR